MNEIAYCAENGKIYIPEYAEKIWEIDGVDGELEADRSRTCSIGDHRNGGVTCKDGYLYFALGLPSNTGFADPDNHGWTDIPNDPFWARRIRTAIRHDAARSGLPRHRPHRPQRASRPTAG